jgi:hypothetical protein
MPEQSDGTAVPSIATPLVPVRVKPVSAADLHSVGGAAQAASPVVENLVLVDEPKADQAELPGDTTSDSTNQPMDKAASATDTPDVPVAGSVALADHESMHEPASDVTSITSDEKVAEPNAKPEELLEQPTVESPVNDPDKPDAPPVVNANEAQPHAEVTATHDFSKEPELDAEKDTLSPSKSDEIPAEIDEPESIKTEPVSAEELKAALKEPAVPSTSAAEPPSHVEPIIPMVAATPAEVKDISVTPESTPSATPATSVHHRGTIIVAAVVAIIIALAVAIAFMMHTKATSQAAASTLSTADTVKAAGQVDAAMTSLDNSLANLGAGLGDQQGDLSE